jgi:hypothetical protein
MPPQPLFWLSFPYRSLYIPNILLMRKNRLPRGEDIKKALGGMWIVNQSCPKQPNGN